MTVRLITTDRTLTVREVTEILPIITEEEIRIPPIHRESRANSANLNIKLSPQSPKHSLMVLLRAKKRMVPFPLSPIRETSTETTEEDPATLINRVNKKAFELSFKCFFIIPYQKLMSGYFLKGLSGILHFEVNRL